MAKYLEFDTPAIKQAADLASEYDLDRHGLTHLDRVFWNLPTPALYEEAVFRGEGHVVHGGPFIVNTAPHTARAASDKYVVNLYDKSGGDEPCDQRSIFRTSDLLELLRRPMVDGVSLQSSKRSREYYMWNPYKDIDYGELQLLRPYVERRTPFINVRLPLPLTAKELTSREIEYETMTIRHDESLCPIAQGITRMHGVCWRVEFPDDLDEPLLLELSKGALADNEVVSLVRMADGKQLDQSFQVSGIHNRKANSQHSNPGCDVSDNHRRNYLH